MPPYDGQGRLFVYSHLASGANMVEYWHWHSIHYGQETYWKGVIGHDLLPNRFYAEVSKTAHELEKIGKSIVNLKINNKAAILYSRDSEFALGHMPFKDGNAYQEVMRQMHKSCLRQNIGVDFVLAENADFSGYSLLLVPPLYIADDVLLGKISDFVKKGGHVVMSVKSGFCDENAVVRHDMAPGPLRKATGFRYQEFSITTKDVALKNDPFGVGADNNKARSWIEYIVPETAKPVAYYDHHEFGKYPAVTENIFGKGTLIYEGCLLTDDIQSKIIARRASVAGISQSANNPAYPVVIREGTNDYGKNIRYFMNYSGKEISFTYNFGGGKELLSGVQVTKNQKLTLKPWDLLIIEE
jgi:beta-galactosidase